MKFEINCPHCNTLLQVSSDLGGQRMACSSCSGEFVVPQVGGDSGKAPPPRAGGRGSAARRGARGGARRSATGGGRSEDARIGEPHFASERHHKKSNNLVEVFLVIGVVLFLGFFIYKFVTREKKSIFEVSEKVATVYTLDELVTLARSDTTSEERYRKYIRNLWRVDNSTKEGKEHERQNQDAIRDMKSYLASQIAIINEGAEQGMSLAAVEKVLREWETDEQAKLKLEDERRAAGAPADGDGGKKTTTEPTPPKDDGLTAEQRADRDGRNEIKEFLATVEVPESYAQRGQWLAGELAKLRELAESRGLGLEKLIYHAARCEELFAAFDRWAKPTERSKASFKWARDSVAAVVAMRKNWDSGLSDETMKESLRTLVDRLKEAESKFTD